MNYSLSLDYVSGPLISLAHSLAYPHVQLRTYHIEEFIPMKPHAQHEVKINVIG